MYHVFIFSFQFQTTPISCTHRSQKISLYDGLGQEKTLSIKKDEDEDGDGDGDGSGGVDSTTEA